MFSKQSLKAGQTSSNGSDTSVNLPSDIPELGQTAFSIVQDGIYISW